MVGAYVYVCNVHVFGGRSDSHQTESAAAPSNAPPTDPADWLADRSTPHAQRGRKRRHQLVLLPLHSIPFHAFHASSDTSIDQQPIPTDPRTHAPHASGGGPRRAAGGAGQARRRCRARRAGGAGGARGRRRHASLWGWCGMIWKGKGVSLLCVADDASTIRPPAARHSSDSIDSIRPISSAGGGGHARGGNAARCIGHAPPP